jgi:hypothetical protein
MNGTRQFAILVEVWDGPAVVADGSIVVDDGTIATRGWSGGFSTTRSPSCLIDGFKRSWIKMHAVLDL